MSAPLIFAVRGRSLAPANAGAEELLKALTTGDLLGVRVAMRGRNAARHRFYWKLLSICAEALSDADQGPAMDADTLHVEIKRALGMGDVVTLRNGEKVFQPRSTSFGRMSEADFIAYLNRVTGLLSRWLHVPPEDLMRIAED